MAVATVSFIAAPRAAHAQYGASGTGFPWQGKAGGVSGSINTATGNRTTAVGTTGWAVRGGRLSVGFTLYHNSNGDGSAATQALHDGLSARWSHSYAIYLTENATTGAVTVHWGDDTTYTFASPGGGSGAISYTAPAGIYDALKRLPLPVGGNPTFTLTTKGKLVYTFDLVNGVYYCSKIADRNNNEITITRDTAGLLTEVKDVNNRKLTFRHTAGRLDKVTNPDGKEWLFDYNTGGDLTTITTPATPTAPNGYTTQVTYNTSGDHRLGGFTDRSGKTWTFGYDTANRFYTEIDALTHATTFNYASGYTDITDALTHATRHSYDPLGRLFSVRDPKLYTESYQYDGNNNVTQITDKNTKVWTRSLDPAGTGNVFTETDPLLHTTTKEYSPFNDVTKITTPTGIETIYNYDTFGNYVGIKTTSSPGGTPTNDGMATLPVDQVGSIVNYGYGQVNTATDGLGHVTTYTRNPNGEVTDITDANTNKQLGGGLYDPLGRLLSSYKGYGNLAVVKEYDALGRVTKATTATTSATPRVTLYEYDGEGRITKVTNPKLEVDTYTYDAVGNLWKHINPRSFASATYTYDAANNLASFINGRNYTIAQYFYNERNEVTEVRYRDGIKEFFTYSPTGHVATKNDLRNLPVTYTYDPADRLTNVTYATGSGMSNITLGYRDDNLKTSMTDGTGTTTYTYDPAGKLHTRATASQSIEYFYDAAGNIDKFYSNTVGTTDYSYDFGNRMTAVTFSSHPAITYGYDYADRLTTTTWPNNANPVGAGATQTNVYDSATGDLSSIWHKTAGGAATIAKSAYLYDALGRRTKETLADGSYILYSYDNLGRLETESRSGASGVGTAYSIVYTYDNAGNRWSKTLNSVTESYTYDTANKLLTAGPKTYNYDVAGNVTSVVNSATSTTTTLAWDVENRLTGITYPGSTTNTFVYNGLGQRISKSDSQGTTNNALISDAINAPMATDGLSGVAYVWGLGLAGERRASTNKYYHTDALGTTRAVTTQAGTTTDTRETDAFGMNWATGTSLTTPTPFGFAGASGYQNDADSGLMMLGHRYYDASVGRFLSRDPIRDGYNWYTYVDNNPVNSVDPTGLETPKDKLKKIVGPLVQTNATLINDSDKWIHVIIGVNGGNVEILLPPGYQTNPKLVDADHVRIPGDWRATHIEGDVIWKDKYPTYTIDDRGKLHGPKPPKPTKQYEWPFVDTDGGIEKGWLIPKGGNMTPLDPFGPIPGYGSLY